MSFGQEALDKAKRLENEYDWTNAAALLEKALSMVEKTNPTQAGRAQERIGFCLHKAAMQAVNADDFKERIQRAIIAYEKAREFYGKSENELSYPRAFRCEAVTKYLGYWLASTPVEKKKSLDTCLELEGRALEIFARSQNVSEYVETYSGLPLFFYCRRALEWDLQTLREILNKGLEWGDKAKEALTKLDSPQQNAKAYFTMALCMDLSDVFVQEPEEQEKNSLDVIEHLNKAVDFSEKAGDIYSSGLSHMWLGSCKGGQEAVRHFETALECGERTRDNFLLAYSLDCLAYVGYWRAIAAEDPEKKTEEAEHAMQLYEKAQHYYSIISFISPRGGLISPPSGPAEHYWALANWSTDPQQRCELLKKSEAAGTKVLKCARDSGLPRVVSGVLHVVSKTLRARANSEAEPRQKLTILQKALEYRKEAIDIIQRVTPFDYWNLGVYHDLLAEIKAELSNVESNPESKKRLLEEAISSKGECLELCGKVMPHFEKMGVLNYFATFQKSQDTYATLLTRLYDMADDPEVLKKAVKVLERAVESAKKLDMVSRIAESHWKIARTHDILGEHVQAAEHFAHASESYLTAAEKIPQLKDLYRDLASYMQAWIEIEKARNHHVKQQYGLAREHYENAANLHESTERWKYLKQNYLAWGRLEEAEDLSRREQTEQAKSLFLQAANLFVEAKSAIKTKFEDTALGDERSMAAGLLDASDMRHEYCLARTTIEDAKILDRQGDYLTGAEKYGEGAERFRRIMEAAPEQTRRELQPILCLCQAWQKMMMAEAKASSTLYAEAAELFKQAKEHMVDRSTSLVASANSSFCKALEAGTEFEIIRDVESYSTAKKHMEAAAECYLKAGYENASEYARATNKLFDAYMYMHKAETETEPQKRAQYYRMAAEVLQASANLFTKAKYAEKSKEVQRLLESAKEEHQLALSLADVLHAPTVAATTTSFSTPTPTYEKAVGLERFEHADVQANLILGVKEAKVGEDVDLEIELVNAGKAPALLVKVQEAIPDAFRIERAPDIYRVEGCNLNMKGKRLDSLMTEQVKMVVKPISKGTFTLRPKVLYMDENGQSRFHEPEPTSITVKELGIKGWIRG